MSCVTCQVSGVRCQASGVRCHMSGVTCQVSHVTFFLLFSRTNGSAATSQSLSPARSLANYCYPATWGRTVWRRQPFATRVAIPPFLYSCTLERQFYLVISGSKHAGTHRYGLQQPGCILCLKLVIYCYSLSHFCDQFWNVTMIMNICFIWQFCGQSINFAKVFHKKKSVGAPRGSNKSARDQNLTKTFADSGRLWLTLVDSDRLWMTLDDSGWL